MKRYSRIEAYNRWERTHLLEAVDPEKREDLACLLENQRLHNESFLCSPKFRRLSIPICRRVFENLVGLDVDIKSDLMHINAKALDQTFPIPSSGFAEIPSLDQEALETRNLCEGITKSVHNFCLKHRGEFYMLGLSEDHQGRVAVYYQL